VGYSKLLLPNIKGLLKVWTQMEKHRMPWPLSLSSPQNANNGLNFSLKWHWGVHLCLNLKKNFRERSLEKHEACWFA